MRTGIALFFFYKASLMKHPTAHAKCRASRSVDKDDAEAAIRVMRFAHYGMEGSHGGGGGEEDGGEHGSGGNVVEVEVESGEEAEAGVQEVGG